MANADVNAEIGYAAERCCRWPQVGGLNECEDSIEKSWSKNKA